MSTQVLIQSISEISLPKINLRKIWIFGFILITLLLVFYIFQISEITTATFAISKQEQEITRLLQQNKDLQIGFSKENSLANLETILNGLNYEKVNKVYYIRVMDSQMVVNPDL